MTYTLLAATGAVVAVMLDLFVLRTRLLTQGRFWFAWAILAFFQVLTNGWLTGRGIVQYDPDIILGLRIAFAPIEDLAFGFALIVVTLAVWLKMGPALDPPDSAVRQTQTK
ncbi:MAG: lycopene cyclase domain-containing protein [Pontimonas sp.]